MTANQQHMDPVEAEEAEEVDETREPGPRARTIVAVVFLAAGVTVLVQTSSIPGPQGLDLRGPRAMPLAVAVIWLLLGGIYLIQQLLRLPERHGDQQRGRAVTATAAATSSAATAALPPARRLALLVAVLAGYAFALAPLGYVLATAAFWVAAARILGSRQWRRDVAVAIALSLTAYLFFTQVLSIRLPEGVLPL
ncbi:tripartite tricarboxylate transporter TctB family protein [Streptomyces sp. 8N616]|uniref:tripartite tricarboxylate transporter TctB family protein n=1 Tax=Streptomyces sp. 8N616 TaxID=3457414 RepID=UPI003FCF436E